VIRCVRDAAADAATAARALTRRAIPLLIVLLVAAVVGCVGGAVGVDAGYGYYGEGPAYDYDLDFYDGPWGYYGGWGPGYFVGPPRSGGRWHGDGRPGGHPYRPAPRGRAVPTIPTGPRGGAMRGPRPR
jgi:hypothetical protein